MHLQTTMTSRGSRYVPSGDRASRSSRLTALAPQLGLAKNPTKNERGDFRYIPNGLPGVETRGPLMWSEGVCKGAFDLSICRQSRFGEPALQP